MRKITRPQISGSNDLFDDTQRVAVSSPVRPTLYGARIVVGNTTF
jgi:hypothetical protein